MFSSVVVCRSITFEDRVDEVLSWFDKPSVEWPHFTTLYLDQPDRAGHDGGPFHDWVSVCVCVCVRACVRACVWCVQH